MLLRLSLISVIDSLRNLDCFRDINNNIVLNSHFFIFSQD
jgi:hypothetical protein